jgi:hypothetical protein
LPGNDLTAETRRHGTWKKSKALTTKGTEVHKGSSDDNLSIGETEAGRAVGSIRNANAEKAQEKQFLLLAVPLCYFVPFVFTLSILSALSGFICGKRLWLFSVSLSLRGRGFCGLIEPFAAKSKDAVRPRPIVLPCNCPTQFHQLRCREAILQLLTQTV